MLPIDLIFVRHGESEGNIATRAAKRGDDRWMTDEFSRQHSSRWRLSPKGREQAVVTGEWLRERFSEISWSKLYVSEYTRALETASLLGLSPARAKWKISPYLRERSRGSLDRAGAEEMRKMMQTRSWADREITPFYWRPPNGESLVDVVARLRNILGTLHRESPHGHALCVCHGEVMESIRIELERMTERDYIEWEVRQESDPSERLLNSQIVWYTRRLSPPEDSEPVSRHLLPAGDRFSPDRVEDGCAPYLTARRSLLISPGPDIAGEGAPPRGEIQFDTGWRELERHSYSDEDLLKIISADPELLDL